MITLELTKEQVKWLNDALRVKMFCLYSSANSILATKEEKEEAFDELKIAEPVFLLLRKAAHDDNN